MGQGLHSIHVATFFHQESTPFNNNPSRSQIDYAAAGYDLVATAIQEGVKTACAAIPGIEIAPLGAGVEAKPDNICEQVVDFVRSLVDLPVGFALRCAWLCHGGRRLQCVQSISGGFLPSLLQLGRTWTSSNIQQVRLAQIECSWSKCTRITWCQIDWRIFRWHPLCPRCRDPWRPLHHQQPGESNEDLERQHEEDGGMVHRGGDLVGLGARRVFLFFLGSGLATGLFVICWILASENSSLQRDVMPFLAACSLYCGSLCFPRVFVRWLGPEFDAFWMFSKTTHIWAHLLQSLLTFPSERVVANWLLKSLTLYISTTYYCNTYYMYIVTIYFGQSRSKSWLIVGTSLKRLVFYRSPNLPVTKANRVETEYLDKKIDHSLHLAWWRKSMMKRWEIIDFNAPGKCWINLTETIPRYPKHAFSREGGERRHQNGG